MSGVTAAAPGQWPDSSAFAAVEGAIAQDAHALVENVSTYLPIAFLYHDEDRIMFYLRRLQQVANLKASGGALSRAVKQTWLHLLITQLMQQGETLQMHVQIKM